MYIYVAISAAGILVVMATIVVAGCIYKQGILLLKPWISNFVITRRFCNNVHPVLSKSKDWKTK
jgi:hypothetical protein